MYIVLLGCANIKDEIYTLKHMENMFNITTPKNVNSSVKYVLLLSLRQCSTCQFMYYKVVWRQPQILVTSLNNMDQNNLQEQHGNKIFYSPKLLTSSALSS